MAMGKAAYLKKITSGINSQFRSVQLSDKMVGTSPPSVFIGQHGYPKVDIGPMITTSYGNTMLYDTPEFWIPAGKKQEDILGFRLQLIRGKTSVGIKDTEHKTVRDLQEITLSKYSVDSEIKFREKPSESSFTLNEDFQPYGPSARMEKLAINPVRWEDKLEKAFYDTDLRAAQAMSSLYENGVLFSQIQRAISTGCFGIKKNRKLVPTRWSITATDSHLANFYYEKVLWSEPMDQNHYEVYEFASLNNYYAIILLPGPWIYEWIEAFIHILGKEEMVFGDYERFKPKKEYSTVGGCYYTAKFAVLEALARKQMHAGALVLREAREGYVPMGVFNVRENVRAAMRQKPKTFGDFRGALTYVSGKLKLPVSAFVDQGVLLRELIAGKRQTVL